MRLFLFRFPIWVLALFMFPALTMGADDMAQRLEKANLKQTPDQTWHAQAVDKLLLHQSTASGDIETLRYLLNHGANVDQRAIIDQATPLHVATYSGDEAIARLLMARGADINAQMNGGNTPLHMAAAGGHLGITKLLLADGADLNLNSGSQSTTTPLHLAARAGFTSLVVLMLRHGADINAREHDQRATALMDAARNGHVAVVALLLRFGADVAARDNDGYSALDIARIQDRAAIVDLLRQRRPEL